ncbi:MAG: hypothetical protein ACO1OF_05755 [Adhaeribacter sp.]
MLPFISTLCGAAFRLLVVAALAVPAGALLVWQAVIKTTIKKQKANQACGTIFIFIYLIFKSNCCNGSKPERDIFLLTHDGERGQYCGCNSMPGTNKIFIGAAR